jgi:hypothetical protein
MTNLNRRAILTGAGSLSLTALAGCSTIEELGGGSPQEADLTSYRTATVELAPNPDIHSATEIVLSSDLVSSEENTTIPTQQQIRVQAGEHSENWRANPYLFTSKTNTSYSQEQTGTVWLSNRGFDRTELEPGDQVTLRPFTTAQEFDSRDQAQNQDELLEQSFDNSGQTIFLAPYGGDMFANTGRQAFVGTSEADLSSWSLYGYGSTSTEARQRWQIPTDELVPDSFIGFAQLSDSYQNVLTFLGMGPDDHSADIVVGGLAPMEERQSVAEALREAFSEDDTVEVVVENTGDVVEDDPAQITNNLSSGNRGGISITQSPEVRREYWYDIGQAMADHFGSSY